MNIYNLKPGENETHIHDVESTSTLLEGNAVMSFNNEQFNMKLNESIKVPSSVVHTMINTGKVECKIECICSGS